MSNEMTNYQNETEEENSFWADVHFYMTRGQHTKEEAMKIVEELYKELRTFDE